MSCFGNARVFIALAGCWLGISSSAYCQDVGQAVAEVQETSPETSPDENTAIAAALAEGIDDSHDANAATQFLRLKKDGNGISQALELAIVTYRAPSEDGISVDLIAAVHIGEKAYYEKLNQRFDDYQVLLYELVAPEGTVVPRGGKRPEGFNPVALLQDTAKDALGLQSQLSEIDYTKPHMVRADMTPSQIADKMAQRGDTPLTLALSTVVDIMREQNLHPLQGDGQDSSALAEQNPFELLANPLKLKQVLAEQFTLSGSIDQSLGKALNQLLIIDRNEEAMHGLQKQIAAGKKRIGVFYGAAHLPDMERRLIDEFGLVKSEQAWLVAWDLTSASETKLSKPVQTLLKLFNAFD
ncbi:MAG: hypothetical protein KDB22_09600 [Planctomycetales bacterium]|nr:hypothetical protein [Planctomycetales bacterium]